MGNESQKLHILFFPFMAHGHMIPMVDIAKLFASKNLKITILTTPLNQPLISRQILNTQNSGSDINIRVINFPTAESGLPEGCENFDFITSKHLGLDVINKFFVSTSFFQDPLEKILTDIRPDCLVADMLFPWTTDSAAKFGIPRLVFHGTSFFSLCTLLSIDQYKPYKNVSSHSELFIVPNLPGEIKLSGNEIPISFREETMKETAKLFESALESELKSFGVIVNSFYELESAYADHYRNFFERRAWSIGPISLYSREVQDKAQRGNQASISEHECLEWLNSKKPNSVVYLCFGSIANFKATQLKEIAVGLESSRKDFIWVVRTNTNTNPEDEHWLPEGFEERMKGKGLIIRGWAPQVLILKHEAIGGFVTHCGWNSTLEGITAGLPMVAWPTGAEQFYNQKFVTQVLKIGVSIGTQESTMYGDHNIIKNECIEKAINRIMEGEEGEEMRRKANELREMARKAVEEGGSSYSDTNALIDELIKFKFH
ncbi:scopoletin glucosyltransferase-like [Euphorbia lathyris]|uniref:scopoletin glucosyltransferase-like n=1 Tax=Euphorbia lathyris TaxID=212925 RepID=UPI0033139282